MTKKHKGPQYRVYVFVHSMLKPVVKGIQGAHAVSELTTCYHQAVMNTVYWAEHDKTLIFLEGGSSKSMKDILKLLQKTDFEYAHFREDRNTLEGLLTAIAVCVPVGAVSEWRSEELSSVLPKDAMNPVKKFGHILINSKLAN